jgi:alkylhydroperoxidase family enzyme
VSEHAKDPKIAAREANILGHPPRVAPRQDLTEEERSIIPTPEGYANAKPAMKEMLLHNVPFVRAYKDIMTYFLMHGALPLRDREILILRVAWLRQIPFVWGEHVKHGKRAGMTSEEIERVTQGSQAPGWGEHDRALVRSVEELIDDAMISDATWATLAKTLSPGLLVELVGCVGQYQALGYLQNSLRVPLFEGNPGLAAR